MTITTREEFEEEDDGEGEGGGGDMAGEREGPDPHSTSANYRDELLHDSPFPTNRNSRIRYGVM